MGCHCLLAFLFAESSNSAMHILIFSILLSPAFLPFAGCWTLPSREFGELFGWIFTALPMAIVLSGVVISQSLIFRYCRNTIKKCSARANMWTSDNADARVRRVAIQSFSYVGAFLLVNLWPTIIRVLDSQGVGDERDVFPLLVLQAIFLPSQGAMNVAIYIRPRFALRRLRCSGEESRWASLLHVLQEEPSSGYRGRRGLLAGRGSASYLFPSALANHWSGFLSWPLRRWSSNDDLGISPPSDDSRDAITLEVTTEATGTSSPSEPSTPPSSNRNLTEKPKGDDSPVDP